MSADPFQRFLGVEASSDPLALLGLQPGDCGAVAIEEALRGRLSRIYRHPDGRRPEAEEVRRRLREAARTLKETGGRQATAPPARAALDARRRPLITLTDFDRHVMAVLVGCGGWNAGSRSKLVALASMYGITVGGLMKVIGGLSEYAKSGGPRLGVAEITSGRSGVSELPPAPPIATAEGRKLLERLAPELREASVESTVKLSLLFGLLTLLVALLAVRVLFFPAGSSEPSPSERSGGVADASAGAITSPPPAEPRPAAERQLRMATFKAPPTFRGAGPSIESVDAADQCPQIPPQIDRLARKIALADVPSEAVYREWEELMRIVGTGWVMADASTLAAIDQSIFEVLHAAADSPSVSDRLLAVFTPPSGRLGDPIDVWRGAYFAATLGRISRKTDLPPVIVERARNQLAIALGDSLIGTSPDFDTAAGAWLERAIVNLVDVLEFDPRVYDYWELWLAVQRKRPDVEQRHAAVMEAIGAILRTGTDLSRPGPSTNVMGRLLLVTDLTESPMVKRRLLGFFDDEAIDVRDVWVLTSLLAQSRAAPWFDRQLVLADDADWMLRRRVRDRIDRRWPHAASAEAMLKQGGGLRVDPLAGDRWLKLADLTLDRSPGRSPDRLMLELVIAGRLTEAAARLAAHRAVGLAEEVMDEVEAMLQAASGESDGSGSFPGRSPGSVASSPPRPGQSIGRDGDWAAAYEQVARNRDDRLQSLRALRTSAGTDLGPIDAEVLVREVYRGSPQDVRAVARAIVAERFATGPNVALEMLDQFPDAPRSESLNDTLRRLTGRLLPPTRSESWAVEARAALVEHALSLRRSGRGAVDLLTEPLIESYLGHLAALSRQRLPSVAPSTPQEAADMLVEAWRDRAATTMGSAPFPADLDELRRWDTTRRRLSRGPIQRFVAAQLAVLDLLAYATVAEQPARRTTAAHILARSAEQRRSMTQVLQQAVLIERTMIRMWRLWFTRSAEARPGGEATW